MTNSALHNGVHDANINPLKTQENAFQRFRSRNKKWSQEGLRKVMFKSSNIYYGTPVARGTLRIPENVNVSTDKIGISVTHNVSFKNAPKQPIY